MNRKRQSILDNTSAQIVLDYIASYRHPQGGPPTQESIAQNCDMTRGYVCKLIKALSDEGYLIKKGRSWYGADIPNREEIEESERIEKARARMLNGQARLMGRQS